MHCSATFLQNLNRNRIDNNSADLIRREDIIDKDVAVITEEKPGVRQNKPPHHFPHDFSKPLKSKQFPLCLTRVNASIFHADEYICDCNDVCLQAEISEDLQMTYADDFVDDFVDEEEEWEEYEEEESYEEFEEFSTDEEYEGKNQDDSAATAAANKVEEERLKAEQEKKAQAEAIRVEAERQKQLQAQAEAKRAAKAKAEAMRLEAERNAKLQAEKAAAERLAKEAAEAKTEPEAFLKEQLRAGLRHEPHFVVFVVSLCVCIDVHTSMCVAIVSMH